MRYLKIKKGTPEFGDYLMLDQLKFWVELIEKYPKYDIIRGIRYEDPKIQRQELYIIITIL